MYNKSKAKQTTTKKNPRHGEERELETDKKQKKIKETLTALYRASLKFKRRESYILSLDINDPERRRRWYELGKERDRRYSTLYRVLYSEGIDALRLQLFW